MRILTIIITYNSEKWIWKNLSSIKESDILVIDNGSVDNTVAIIEKEFPAVRLIKSSENLGFSAANNVGFEIAKNEKYDWVFLVNHDAWLAPNCISEMTKLMCNPLFADFGILSPVHFSGDQKSYDFGFERFCDTFELEKNISNKIDFMKVKNINGAFMMINMKCLQILKGFDPIFFFYGEDTDFCRRALSNGFEIAIITNSKAYHDRGKRVESLDRINKHLIANSLIQLKGMNNKFMVSYFKTIFGLVYLHLTTITDYKDTIIYLLKNYSKISKSMKNYPI